MPKITHRDVFTGAHLDGLQQICMACGRLIFVGWFAPWNSDNRIKCGTCSNPQRLDAFPFANHDPGDEDPSERVEAP
jgi:hypothetical protein